MDVDLINVYAVHMALRFPDQTVYRHNVVLHIIGDIQVSPDDMLDVVKSAVAVCM